MILMTNVASRQRGALTPVIILGILSKRHGVNGFFKSALKVASGVCQTPFG